MDNGGPSVQIVRFGTFEADLQTGELRKNGHKVPLQGQPFQVFAILLQHSGKLVTREELRQKVWPEDTFVDFDHGLNTAITKIRTALGDDADNPRFVETMPRRGYRFIAPLEGHPAPKPDTALPVPKRWSRFSTNSAWLAVGSAALILVCTVALLRLVRRPAEQSSLAVEVVPLVAMEGKQGWPAFSPDGNQVAFAEYEGPRRGIYTTLLGGEKPLRLTENPRDCCPAWSPDGQQIAFVRFESDTERSIFTLPVLGGSEHRLYTGLQTGFDYCDGMDWSPDGKAVVFPERKSGGRSHISMLSITDLTVKPLTSPVPGEVDCEPAFSSDGLSVGFVRGWGGNFGDLFVIPISGGEPRRLTSNNSGGTFAWTPDGREIVFSSMLSGIQSLRRISASGGTSRPIEGVGGPAAKPSISRRGNYLVYQQAIQNDNIWRINLKDERHATGLPTQAFASRGFIYRPDFSPDGKKVAFESDRLGYSDIWVCASDGSNCTQVTDLHTITGTARWSPDGRYLAFESEYQHFWHLYTVQVPGGRPRLVNTGLQGYVGCPNWSRDSQWIYVCSNQSGPMQLWKVPFKGGAAVQVTTHVGVYAIESDDGRSLYYFGRDSLGGLGILRKPLNGGEETRVLVSSSLDWFAWALTHTGIYFVDRSGLAGGGPREFQKINAKIEYMEFATREITPIFSLEKPSSLWGGVTVSPDGRALYWGQTDRDDSYIMLVKNFR